MPYRPENSNKGTFGKVLNLSGSKNYIGAAFLSTASCLKIGAGLVALSTEKEVINSVSAMLPEAVYLSRNDGLKNIKNYTVCLIGCGLGTGFKSVRIFKAFINELIKYDYPVVIDADGLNILAKNNALPLPENVIITPHPIEAARLLNTEPETVLNNLKESAKLLTEKYNCTTVLKTHQTIICDKNNLFINTNGCSALAKAGSGDVLAGIIAGLLAQKMPMFEAARLGVYLHAQCGEISSESLTNYSVMASDLIKAIPLAIKNIIN